MKAVAQVGSWEAGLAGGRGAVLNWCVTPESRQEEKSQPGAQHFWQRNRQEPRLGGRNELGIFRGRW